MSELYEEILSELYEEIPKTQSYVLQNGEFSS
jgi:hypothetical protein